LPVQPSNDKVISDKKVLAYSLTTGVVVLAIAFLVDRSLVTDLSNGETFLIGILTILPFIAIYGFIATCVNALIRAIKESKPD
jgi:hypothetical protein